MWQADGDRCRARREALRLRLLWIGSARDHAIEDPREAPVRLVLLGTVSSLFSVRSRGVTMQIRKLVTILRCATLDIALVLGLASCAVAATVMLWIAGDPYDD